MPTPNFSKCHFHDLSLSIFSSLMICCYCLYPTLACKSQQLIFRDLFNTSRGTIYTNVPGVIGNDTLWQLNRSGADWGVKIDAGRMEVTNDAGALNNLSGWAFAYVDNTVLPSWQSTLANNTEVISWTLNMRQPRNDPSGFTINNYGAAFILGCSHPAPFDSGFGYAVVIGQAGTVDPVRLVRYNNGLSGSITDLIISNTIGLTDLGNEYLSIEVRYSPLFNKWELLLKNDGSNGFQDPASAALISQGLTIDQTYTTSVHLKYTGAYWSGNTALLQNAMFDNIQISASCSNTQLFYRTRKSGKWHDQEIWEMSTDLNGTYRAACYYPTIANSKKVLIKNGDTVIIDNNFSINIGWITILDNGVLILNNNAILNIGNGNINGADLENNGCLIDNANTGYGIDFLPNTGAAWSMSPNATLIRSNGSNATPYRDHYHNGMSNIPATANWIIRYTGNPVPLTTTGTGVCPCSVSFPSATYYPNLIIESNAGIWNTGSSIGARFAGKLDYATIKGNLNIGGNGTGAVLMYNENTHPVPMKILGDIIIKNGSMLSNYNPAFPIQIGTGLEAKGNIKVDGVLKIDGDGILTLTGSSPQFIEGKGTIDLQNLTILNSSATGVGDVILNRPLTVGGVLELNQGIVNSSAENLLIMDTAATCPAGGNLNAFISGPMQKKGKSNFIFPLGKPTQNIQLSKVPGKSVRVGGYHPIGIKNISGNENFISEYHLRDPYLEGSISQTATAAGLQSINRCEYWDLKRTGSEHAEVMISWSNHEAGQSDCNAGTFVTDTNTLQVVPYFNNMWGDQYASYFGKTGIIGEMPPSAPNHLSFISWNGDSGRIENYKKFVLGTTSQRKAPLSIPLQYFRVKSDNHSPEILWSLTEGHNVKYLDIERSPNGVDFVSIKKITEWPDNIAHHAAYKDMHPSGGWNFYRLHLKDLDRNNYYSNIEKNWIDETGYGMQIFPNPAKEKICLRIGSPDKVTSIYILNNLGLRITTIDTPLKFQEIACATFPPGIYYMQAVGYNGIMLKRFIKN
jgi:hypothetical protein